jgi:hypothetical protein
VQDGFAWRNSFAIAKGKHFNRRRERPQQIDDVVHSTEDDVTSLKDLIEDARAVARVLTGGAGVEEIVVGVAVQPACVH